MKKLFGLSLLLVTLVSCSHHDDPAPAPASSANWADSLNVGLWAWFPFYSSNLSDQSGHHRDLRGENGIVLGNDRDGNAQKALAFDGQNDFAVIDSGIHFPAGNFAISFSVNASNTNLGRIFNKADFNTALGAATVFGFEPVVPNVLHFGVTKDNNVCSNYSDLNNTNELPSYRIFLPNQWYNVVVQFNHGVQSIYMNGQLVSAMYTPNTSFPMCNNAPMYFGIWWLQDLRAFSGRLDNIRIYTRALQEDEIRYLNVNNL